MAGPQTLNQLRGKLKYLENECGYLNSRDQFVSIGPCFQANYGALCDIKGKQGQFVLQAVFVSDFSLTKLLIFIIADFPGCGECGNIYPTSACSFIGQSCILTFCGINSWYEGRNWCHNLGGDLFVPKGNQLDALLSGIWNKFKGCNRFWTGISRFEWISNGTHYYSCGLSIATIENS